MLAQWLTKARNAKPPHSLHASVTECFSKIPVICTHKCNLIIRVFRDTLFRDTHMASRSTLDLGELTLDVKRCCGIPSPVLPSSLANFFRFWGFQVLFIAFLIAWQKVSVTPTDFIPFWLYLATKSAVNNISTAWTLASRFYVNQRNSNHTISLECKGPQSPPPHAVLEPRVWQSPGLRAGGDGYSPLVLSHKAHQRSCTVYRIWNWCPY